MDLILMRHGKAELRSDAKPDFERELTSIGRKKIKQAARGLACSLYKGRDVQIWTSPAVRTLRLPNCSGWRSAKNANCMWRMPFSKASWTSCRSSGKNPLAQTW